MPRAIAKCLDCPTLCFGKRCRPCALAYGVKNYNRKGSHAIDAGLPQDSWWLDTPDFYAAAKNQLARMSGGGVSYVPRFMGD